ncbi:MAG TPA: M28 family metallopeptidase [Kofleriaceae bacterium]|nr:M28 family metallopeptidase [Kofleriaceae bacterium]
MRVVAALAIAAVAACTPSPQVEYDDRSDAILGQVRALADRGPRPGDTAQSEAALAYIEHQLDAAGIAHVREPVGTVELPAIDAMGTHVRSASRVTSRDPNLVVRLGPAGGHALLVMAHYDSVPASPGAVDNAAAVGVLIELARVLAASPPPQPVILVFTANEERGLVGAEALADHHAGEIGFAIALDLVGGTGALTLNGASELVGRAELAWIAAAADRAGVIVRAPPPHRVISRRWPQLERSDHGAFTRRGVRAVHFYHRGQDGDWIDLAYHSERDTTARVDRRAVADQLNLLRALASSPIPPHAGDGFWLPVVANTVVPRWTLVLACLVLAAGALALLRRLPTRTIARDRPRLGLAAGLGCFVVAALATYAIERGVSGDHPAPWLHAPSSWLAGETLVLAGVLGLVTRLVARWWPWTGERRYTVVATLVPLAIGLLLLAAGAAELAWIWIVPAVFGALAPRLGRFGLPCVLALAAPAILVLWPAQLREAAWNGFLPGALPLIAWIAVLGAPAFAGLAAYLRAHPYAGPLGTLVLPLGCALAIVVGIGVLANAPRPCSRSQFQQFQLACEARPGVH